MDEYHNLRTSILCHETNVDAAKSIINSGYMKPSHGGYIGPGVYFAESKEACQRKAHRHGCFILSAVNLGRLYEIYLSDHSLTPKEVRDKGYDSVRGYKSRAPEGIAFNTGTEYCVFDPKRITPLFAQIEENKKVYYLFRTNTPQKVIRIDDIPLDRLVIIINDKQICVCDNHYNKFAVLDHNEPLLANKKLIFTNEGNFEFTKIVHKLK